MSDRRGSVRPTAAERAAALPGDVVVPRPDVVMDRGCDLPAPPEAVWPWLVQLGKARAGWYLPRSVERFVPRSRRAVRHVDAHWQGLAVGDVVPDYGGPHETFTVEQLDPPHGIVYSSQRGRIRLSWELRLTEQGGGTRLHLRLRLAPVRRRWLAESVGEWFDLVTIAGMAAGLRERLAEQ